MEEWGEGGRECRGGEGGLLAVLLAAVTWHQGHHWLSSAHSACLDFLILFEELALPWGFLLNVLTLKYESGIRYMIKQNQSRPGAPG